jgi:ABC-type dipeptide/oligopeptide/nickel transport system ATPase subunit
LREGSLATSSGEQQILERLWPGASMSSVGEILDVYPKPYRPSGGEKQRILVAMALKKMSIVEPAAPESLFIFDEPTGNLDNELRNRFLDLLVEYFRKRNNTVLLITHDYSMISRFVKSYPAIANRIHYKELILQRGTLRLRDFQPDEYLSWLVKSSSAGPVPGGGKTLLELDTSVRVFGRTLRISRDRQGNAPTPLLIRKGAITYLKAPSGTGKTTIVKLMMGLLRSEKMTMRLGTMTLTEGTPRTVWAKDVWGRQMTMVFQHADEALNQNARVKDVFAGLPLATRFDDAMVMSALSELFDEKPDPSFLLKPVMQLSGGQKQRLNLLRSLVLDTDILILDEPLNGLDFTSAVKVLSKLEQKIRDGKGVLIISHNEEIFDTIVRPVDTYYLHASA